MSREKNNGDLGDIVKYRRRWLGMTQEDLAKKAGLGRTTITNIEAGRQGIAFKNLRALAKALDGTIDQIIPALEEDTP